MLVRRILVVSVSVVWSAAAQQSTPVTDPDAALRAARVHSKALFEGADDLDTPTVEEYRAHLAGMCKGVVDTVTAYPGLARALPDIAADQPRTPALAIGNDFSRLFGQEAVPSEQARKEDNYYAKLTLKQDPYDPQGRNYQQRLEAAILAYDGKLYPSGVLVMALDATHGNYPLAVLAAHNLLKEYTETGRAQEADGPSPPNGRQGPKPWVWIRALGSLRATWPRYVSLPIRTRWGPGTTSSRRWQ